MTGARVRLIVGALAPIALVAFGFHGVGDLRVAFLAYIFGGCALVPALLFRIRPLASAGGLPFVAPGEGLGRWTGLPLALGLFGPAFFGAYYLLRKALTAPEPYVERLVAYGWDERFTPLYLVIFLLFVPLFEEWWWRGQFLPRAEAAFGRAHGWWLSGVGFALYHIVVLLVLYDPGLAFLRFSGIAGGGPGVGLRGETATELGLGLRRALRRRRGSRARLPALGQTAGLTATVVGPRRWIQADNRTATVARPIASPHQIPRRPRSRVKVSHAARGRART